MRRSSMSWQRGTSESDQMMRVLCLEVSKKESRKEKRLTMKAVD